jgi:hypothetical protein
MRKVRKVKKGRLSELSSACEDWVVRKRKERFGDFYVKGDCLRRNFVPGLLWSVCTGGRRGGHKWKERTDSGEGTLGER